MNETPQLGQFLEPHEHRRDAIHIAIAPITAAEMLTPGQHVGLVQAGNTELAGPCAQPIGIVDPFLPTAVAPGQRCWLFLYPGSIVGLRHVWSHPAFTAAANHREKRT